MRIVTRNTFSERLCDRSVVTIGNFDGVHRGHQSIFQQVAESAAKLNADSVVVTFSPHPLRVLRPDDRRFCLISTDEQKQKLIAESDIDLLLVIPFTLEFAALSAEQFVQQVLHTCLGTERLIIGHDYVFGRGREGNEQFLRTKGMELGFAVQAIEPVGDGSRLFSSTAVRKLVAGGDVRDAAQILGRCHCVHGQVVHGREIGRALGFPTANIVTHNELIPGDGVYAVWVSVRDELYMGACSIGVNPTFSGGSRTIEVFLFDFTGDLYGEAVDVQYVERLRSIIKFNDSDALKQQIATDIRLARRVLEAHLPVERSA